MPAGSARARRIRVSVEATDRRAFASAVDWPGWSRPGKTEQAALEALAEHADRYRVVAKQAHLAFAPADYTVIERVRGGATTDFGAPERAAAVEAEALDAAAARRMVALVSAAWTVFDQVVASAPASLRKGPRGGGRDRDAIVEHVLSAENAYARKLGVTVAAPRRGAKKEISAQRDAVIDVLAAVRAATPLRDRGWLPRYAARRIAWHVLDHAWEIENRSES